MSEPILVQRKADIATVLLYNTDKLNVLTKLMWQRLL